MRTIVPLVVLSLAIMGSPGPATISLMAAGAAYGLRRPLPYLIGVIVGTTIVLVAVATGLTAALLAYPAVGHVLYLISAAYIVWLAYHIATARPMSDHSAASRALSLPDGILLGVANPKAWVAIAAVFANAHITDDAAADAIVKTLVLTFMVALICAVWFLAGSSLARSFRDARRSRMINIALAAALVATMALAAFR